MFDKDAIKEIAQAQAIAAANDAVLKCDDVVALPEGFDLHDLEKYQGSRRRMRGSMTTSVLDSFAAYAIEHAEPGGAAVFADPDNLRAVAVLNLGDVDAPGHADHTATFVAKETAAYLALRAIAKGQDIQQRQMAEFLEDWEPLIITIDEHGTAVPVPRAIEAVRNITIEGLRRVQAEQASLSESKGVFEQVAAKDTYNFPTTFVLRTAPAVGLPERDFKVRVGIRAGDKPALVLRLVKIEEHTEQMAVQLAQLVREAIAEQMPVYIGKHNPHA